VARGTKMPVVLTFVGVMAMSACATSTTSSEPSGTGAQSVKLIKDGTLTVCTHLDYAPFQSRQGDKIVGFDVDVLDEVAKDLGVKQEITDVSFEGIESGESLSTNQCDAAAAAMTITDVRKEKLDFSDPYFDATQALLVKKGSGITGLAQLRGKKVGTQLATTGEKYAGENKAANGYDTVQFEDLPLEVTAVQTGQVDAAINDNGVFYDFIKSNPDVEVATEFDTGEHYGIGVRKGNSALHDKVNAALARIRKDGTYDTIYEKWFGKKPS
jgi:polar amino acid transport system substrate-binding protein